MKSSVFTVIVWLDGLCFASGRKCIPFLVSHAFNLAVLSLDNNGNIWPFDFITEDATVPSTFGVTDIQHVIT